MTNWVPDACTLPSAEQPVRVEAFDALFAGTLREVARPGPTRLELRLAGGSDLAARVRDLTARESACCSFFAFTVAEEDGEVHLGVTVPAAQAGVLDALAARYAG